MPLVRRPASTSASVAVVAAVVAPAVVAVVAPGVITSGAAAAAAPAAVAALVAPPSAAARGAPAPLLLGLRAVALPRAPRLRGRLAGRVAGGARQTVWAASFGGGFPGAGSAPDPELGILLRDAMPAGGGGGPGRPVP